MTKNLKEKWKEFDGLYGDIGRTDDDILLFIETLLQEQKEEFIEGRRCLTCGELKGKGGELSSSCGKCLEME